MIIRSGSELRFVIPIRLKFEPGLELKVKLGLQLQLQLESELELELELKLELTLRHVTSITRFRIGLPPPPIETNGSWFARSLVRSFPFSSTQKGVVPSLSWFAFEFELELELY